MKIVINRCYGGFSLSKAAVKRLAELQGRPCYFFGHHNPAGKLDLDLYYPEGEEDSFSWQAFDVPNPNEVLKHPRPWHEMTLPERQAANALHALHDFETRPENRADPILVQVVEELGGGHRQGASGHCADLQIVEIPDGIEYTIEEYDGMEHVAEVHRTWRGE